MAEERVQRRLAAILAADVVGYSRMMRADEAGTLARLKSVLDEVIDPRVAEYGGRVVKLMGDGILIEFPSAVDAVQHAVDVQRAMAERDGALPEDSRIAFRIGINLGDVIVDGDDIYGDGVNIASRLEGLAEPGGITVADVVHASVRDKLDIGFVDRGRHEVKNIAEPVHVFAVALDADDTAASDALFRRPAVAVLPFVNMSGDPEQEYFADGLTEDIITALSRFRSFPVIARNSTFAYKGAAPDIRKVGEELGARYAVEGSVRKSGNRVRVTAQLIDAETGHHVWAERYDRELDDIFALQDEMALRIGAIIEPAIAHSEVKRIAAKPPTDLGAWDLCMQGFGLVYEGTKEANGRAREIFEQAIARDADYARAWTGLAYTHFRDIRLGYTDDRAAARAKGVEAARRATALDDTDSEARVLLSRAMHMSGRPDDGIAEARRAVDLNPLNSTASWNLGSLLYMNGRAEEGVPWIEKALEINPLDPQNYIVRTHLAVAHICVGDYERAAELARAAIRQRDDYIDSHLTLASALGHLDRADDARTAAAPFMERADDYVDNHPFWGDAAKACFRDGLRKAGIVE